MKLGYIIIYVKDLKATVAFYKKAFGIKCKFIHPKNDYAEMETGATSLAFASEVLAKQNGIKIRPNRIAQTSAGVEIAFATKDVTKAFKKAITAGGKTVLKPTKKPWGQTVAYVKDNNGFLVEICSPVAV